MAKIQVTRLRNADKDYDPEVINQIIRALEQVIQALNTTYASDRQQNAEAAAWMNR